MDKKRNYGQKRRDKDLTRRANPQSVGRQPAASEHDLLDVRICFRVNTEIRDLSWRVRIALGMTKGELYRGVLLNKAAELGLIGEDQLKHDQETQGNGIQVANRCT